MTLALVSQRQKAKSVVQQGITHAQQFVRTDAFLQNPAPNVRDREKMEGGKAFRLQTEFTAAGDQPTAIKELVAGVQAGEQNQVLLGATGTGKTFTMARIIQDTQRPAIILAPTKPSQPSFMASLRDFPRQCR